VALLPYGWCTFIEAAIEQLANLGIRQIDLVVSSRPEELRHLLGMGERWGVNLRWHLVKDFATPSSVLRAIGLEADRRVLLGQAGHLVPERVLSALIERDQVAAVAQPDGIWWAGWASTDAGRLLAKTQLGDDQALGQFLCQYEAQLLLIDTQECVHVNHAVELLDAQLTTLTDEALARAPATWLQTEWGAYSPEAVVQTGALMARPTLVGPGCFVAAGARIGPATVLTRDVLVSADATVCHSVVFPDTFIGQGLELDQTLVNAQSVQHLSLGVRTVLPESEGLLLDLQPQGEVGASWLSRLTAGFVCLALLPWLAADTLLRGAKGLPLRWQPRQAVSGRDPETGEVQLRTLRCASPVDADPHYLLTHYGAWLDVLAGHRRWFGVRPRSAEAWHALPRDWQLLLANMPIGCLHAPAWREEGGDHQEAEAAADVYFAVRHGVQERWRIWRAWLRR